jgi:hypothetical protein
MKKIITLLFLINSSFALLGQEVTIFDSNGESTAYVDLGELTIYLWNGTPTTYLEPVGDDFNIYGYNGEHLGWLENGIIRNHEGLIVGFSKGSLNIQTKNEPFKPSKRNKPFKSPKKFAPYKPFSKNKFSSEPLSIFLMLGI